MTVWIFKVLDITIYYGLLYYQTMSFSITKLLLFSQSDRVVLLYKVNYYFLTKYTYG